MNDVRFLFSANQAENIFEYCPKAFDKSNDLNVSNECAYTRELAMADQQSLSLCYFQINKIKVFVDIRPVNTTVFTISLSSLMRKP